MAGATKETTRQKMIGMMYIVLTAMLALQVTNTVLDKFVLIDESLQKSAFDSRDDNIKTIKRIRKSIKDRGNREEDQEILRRAQDVINRSDLVLEKIKTMRTKIIELSGGYDEENQYENIEEEDEVMSFTLGNEEKKDGEAYKLQQMLEDYVAYINSIDTTVKVKQVALNAWEIDRFMKDEDQNNKDFAHINFEETPMIAALAVLSQFQNDVVNAETSILDILANKVGAEDIPFDQVEAFVSPESRVIPAGTPYKAKVMLVASSSAAKPEMKSSIGNIEVGADGKGDLEFIASSSNFDTKGQALQKWTGEITINTPQGLQTFEVEEEYVVQKPSLQFVSAAIQSLYYNAGNTIQVMAPELGIHYDPQFEITGGTIKPEAGKGKITIIPTGKTVELKVKNKGALLGVQKFRVKPIPKPEIQVYNNKQPIDQVKGGRLPSYVNVRAIPDGDFLETNPLDARYKVTNWEIMLVRNNTAIDVIRSQSENVDIRQWQSRAKKGDQILFQINEVKRKNFTDDIEPVSIGLKVFRYPIN
ncbi:gliding motility protein GldM [Chondrinema litorale]|uniref:type IX secretion system motor protein PorM/GldM n=1 Tax=Chondrinema litorale TaxID=2994555 RepID=UPI002542DCB4|nr:gliding motility protein GldM [Chondrinema litorale]UZR94023.1 gliding motility protein GldM [Chondrinema litorale]